MQSKKDNSMKKKIKLMVLFSLSIVIALVMYSCYIDYGLTASDYDTVITLYDKSADYNKPTYAMPDSVVHLVESGKASEDINRSHDALILSTVESNLSSLGYTRVDITSPDAPDFVILVAVTKTSEYGAVSYSGWGYWGGWGWWGGYPGYYYPNYVSVYSYTTGSIFIDMIDPDKLDTGSQAFGAIWVARINGVLSSSYSGSTAPATRIPQRINEAFDQSTYLGVN